MLPLLLLDRLPKDVLSYSFTSVSRSLDVCQYVFGLVLFCFRGKCIGFPVQCLCVGGAILGLSQCVACITIVFDVWGSMASAFIGLIVSFGCSVDL